MKVDPPKSPLPDSRYPDGSSRSWLTFLETMGSGGVGLQYELSGDDEIGQRTLFAEVLLGYLEEVQYSSRRRGCRWKSMSKFKSSLPQVRTR